MYILYKPVYLKLVKLVLLHKPVGQLVGLDGRREVSSLIFPEVYSLADDKVVPVNLSILNCICTCIRMVYRIIGKKT